MRTLIALTVMALWAWSAQAQINTPAPSPSCKLQQTVGLTEVTVEYSRPGVKGRTIFAEDGLVPFGKMWRTGANRNTVITFSDDVKVEGNDLKAGSYALYTIPGADAWTIIFYTDTNNWGLPQEWDTSKEAARFVVRPVEHCFTETFTINIDKLRNESAEIQLIWERTLVPIKLEVDVDSKVMADIKRVMGGPTRSDYYAAARYYYEADKDLEQALEWVRKANELDPRYWQYRLEAQILAKMRRYDEAIQAAKKSLELAKEAGNEDYVRMNQKDIDEWSKMAGGKE